VVAPLTAKEGGVEQETIARPVGASLLGLDTDIAAPHPGFGASHLNIGDMFDAGVGAWLEVYGFE
jgi:hypothetical protein